jgi:asparagine synthase (glutamine-hydrolysing)
MCGIAGLASIEGPLNPVSANTVPLMTHALAHRGPDGFGFFADSVASLGHSRLAIIDRAGGSQPMTNEDRSCWIVFNGEVYNHHALRATLESRGHVFRTRSDTEAILHAYEEYGTGCVERLEGMFAFAIYDVRRRALFLARDRVGKKPLFYLVADGMVLFASEMKALMRHPSWDGSVDTDALHAYLALGYVPAPHTIYRRVKKLEPGHWLLASKGSMEIRRYWDVPEFDTEHGSQADVLRLVEGTIDSAVRARLESEVPLGAFLSGGIDSGLVVSFMADALGSEIDTASVGFAEREHNELEAAELTAKRFRTRHHPSIVAPRLEGILDRIVGSFDEPFADASAVPTFYVSQQARQHVTVALTGDGGDEAFGGYSFRYVPHAVERRIRAWLPDTAADAAGWLGKRWPRSPRLPRPVRLGTLLENLARDGAAAYYSDLCFLKPPAVHALLGIDRDPFEGLAASVAMDAYRRCPSSSPLQRAQYADLHVYLPNDPLVKVDRMSMANSLEIRCPLLDRQVIELAFRLPTEAKMPSLRPKHLLRQLGGRRLPREIQTLPKRGFTAPVAEWMARTYADLFRGDVLSGGASIAGLVDLGRVATLFDQHVAGHADHGYALWAVWMLERWARTQESLRHAPARELPVLVTP